VNCHCKPPFGFGDRAKLLETMQRFEIIAAMHFAACADVGEG
jgi:UDP-glucose 4-epimerase